MKLELNQGVWAKGYISVAKYLHGSISNYVANLGYGVGRLSNGFFVARLLRYPTTEEFNIAGYSYTPEHRFKTPEGYDILVLKKLALESMYNHGLNSLVKVFPTTPHSTSLDDYEQYPFGKGGIPQWKLIKEVPMYVFKEVKAGERGNISLYN